MATVAAWGTKFAAGAARRELGKGRVIRDAETAAFSWARASADSSAAPRCPCTCPGTPSSILTTTSPIGNDPLGSSTSPCGRGWKTGASADIFELLGGGAAEGLDARRLGGLDDRIVDIGVSGRQVLKEGCMVQSCMIPTFTASDGIKCFTNFSQVRLYSVNGSAVYYMLCTPPRQLS